MDSYRLCLGDSFAVYHAARLPDLANRRRIVSLKRLFVSSCSVEMLFFFFFFFLFILVVLVLYTPEDNPIKVTLSLLGVLFMYPIKG